MYVCICVCVCMYVCMNICMYVCVYVCMYVCLYVCMCVYWCMYVCMCVYVCMYVYVSMYVCMCVCMYVCVCMHVWVVRPNVHEITWHMWPFVIGWLPRVVCDVNRKPTSRRVMAMIQLDLWLTAVEWSWEPDLSVKNRQMTVGFMGLVIVGVLWGTG